MEKIDKATVRKQVRATKKSMSWDVKILGDVHQEMTEARRQWNKYL